MDVPLRKPNSVITAFKDLEDPRKIRNQNYNLFDIITISILGILCGADDRVATGDHPSDPHKILLIYK